MKVYKQHHNRKQCCRRTCTVSPHLPQAADLLLHVIQRFLGLNPAGGCKEKQAGTRSSAAVRMAQPRVMCSPLKTDGPSGLVLMFHTSACAPANPTQPTNQPTAHPTIRPPTNLSPASHPRAHLSPHQTPPHPPAPHRPPTYPHIPPGHHLKPSTYPPALREVSTTRQGPNLLSQTRTDLICQVESGRAGV